MYKAYLYVDILLDGNLIFLLATTISYFHLDISLFSANLPPVHLHSNTSFFIRILFFIQILIRIYLPCRDFLFLKSTFFHVLVDSI